MKLGINGKLYQNTGAYGSPTWVEITNVRDLTLNMDAAEADATTPGSPSCARPGTRTPAG